MSEVELWDTAAARTSGSSGQAPRQTCKRCLTILCNIRRRQYLHLILGFLSAKIFLRGGLKIHCLTLSYWWVDISTWTSKSHNWLYYYWRAHALSKDCKKMSNIACMSAPRTSARMRRTRTGSLTPPAASSCTGWSQTSSRTKWQKTRSSGWIFSMSIIWRVVETNAL